MTVIVHAEVNQRLMSLLEFLRGFPNGNLGQTRLKMTYHIDSWDIRISSGDTDIATVCYVEGAMEARVYLRKHRVAEAKNFLEMYQENEPFTFHLYALHTFVS